MSKTVHYFVKTFLFSQLGSQLHMQQNKIYYFTQPNIAIFEGAVFPIWVTWHREDRKHYRSYLCTEGNPSSGTWTSSGQCEITVFASISARAIGEDETDVKKASVWGKSSLHSVGVALLRWPHLQAYGLAANFTKIMNYISNVLCSSYFL